jgi:3-hydroxybutyryl-CoA dehydratase
LKYAAHDPSDETISAIDATKRRVTLKTQCLNGDKVVIDGEAVVLVPRRAAK